MHPLSIVIARAKTSLALNALPLSARAYCVGSSGDRNNARDVFEFRCLNSSDPCMCFSLGFKGVLLEGIRLKA